MVLIGTRCAVGNTPEDSKTYACKRKYEDFQYPQLSPDLLNT